MFTLYPTMLPFSIMTFWSLIQAPSTPRRVEVARATPCWTASSKLVSEMTLSSVTLATDIGPPLPWLAYCYPEHLLPALAENKRFVQGLTSGRSLEIMREGDRQYRAQDSSLTHDEQPTLQQT